jgi:hypothetical protein
LALGAQELEEGTGLRDADAIGPMVADVEGDAPAALAL